MKRPKEPAETSAEWIRVYVWRADKMIEAALAGRSGGKAGWLKIPRSDRARYQELRKAAAEVMRRIDKIEAAGDTDTLTLIEQYGMLRHVADGWDLRRVQPQVWRYAGVREQGKKNLAKGNADRRAEAEALMISRFATWQNDSRDVLDESMSARRRAALFAKYSAFNVGSVARRRLFALANSGRLPSL